MRRSSFFRGLALGALAAALWLAPGWIKSGASGTASSASTPAESASDAGFDDWKNSRARPAPAFAAAALPSASVPSVGSLVVALDELYSAHGRVAAGLISIPPQADLDALLAYAAGLPAPAPRLVLYPPCGPRNAATRRILNPALEVALESPSAATPAPRPDLGVVAWERPAYAPSHAIARIAGDPAQPLRAAAALAGASGIFSARPLLARQLAKMAIPNDPLFKDQWHLRNTGQQGGKSGVDIRAVPAWDTATGAGIVIGIVDDGLDYYHPDLSPAYQASLGQDWNDDDADPVAVLGGLEGDNHGTAVAGLAAARGNNFIGMDGAAPSASLAGLRLISAPTDDSEEAEAMAWRNDAIAIKNNSWGPAGASPDEGISPGLSPSGALWRAAVADAVATGRNGLGTLIFFASGNGQADGDQGPKNGYASFRGVIPVGAVTNKGALASFGEGGPHLVVVAPGDASVGIATTDRVGDAGYNTYTEGFRGDYLDEVNYTKVFGGTSAAAPIASGVAALLLELRPDLGWRDVKEIFLRSSTKLSSTSRDWTTRPAGDAVYPIKHHPRLGGGLVNALAALTLARDWTTLGAEQSLTTGILTPERPIDPKKPAGPKTSVIADAGAAFVVATGAFFEADNFAAPASTVLRVEHVELTLDITHTFRGDLEIKLTSPAGTTSVFTTASKADDGADYKNEDGTAGYTFSSVRHWGEPSAGVWTISVRDTAKRDVGVWHSAILTLHGTRLTVPVVSEAPEAQALTTGSTLRLHSAFTGGNLTYQWTRDGKPIKGATSPDYRLENFSAKTAGVYSCVATNSLGSTGTPAVAIAVDDTPARALAGHVGSAQDFDLNEFLGLLPSDGYTVAGLPPGLKLDRAAGRLSGTVRKAGAWRVAFTFTHEGVATRLYLAVDIDAHYPSYAGNYGGHLSALGLEYNRGLGGLVTLTLNADGRYTGKLVYGDLLYPLSGVLKNTASEGEQSGSLTLAAKKPLPALRLNISSNGEEQMEITLRAPGMVDGATCFPARDNWSAANPTPLVGTYLFTATSALPDGTRQARVIVAGDGVATWELSTADGTVLRRGSSRVNKWGWIPVYATTAAPAGETTGVFNLYDLDETHPTPSSFTWNPATPASGGATSVTLSFIGGRVP